MWTAGNRFVRSPTPAMACVKTYKGLGFQGYVEAVKFLKDYLSNVSKRAFRKVGAAFSVFRTLYNPLEIQYDKEKP